MVRAILQRRAVAAHYARLGMQITGVGGLQREWQASSTSSRTCCGVKVMKTDLNMAVHHAENCILLR